MGLISVANASMRGALKDIWRDYFYIDSIPEDILVIRANKRTNKKKSDNDNIVSNGSIIAVNDGQCAIVTLNGTIQEICSQPGEFVYNQSTEPSMLCDGFIKDTLKSIGTRFKFGGYMSQEYRVYYINTKEIFGMNFGTSNPLSFRVVDNRAGIDIDIRLRMAGAFTIRVINPVTLYQNVTGNVTECYETYNITPQLRAELLSALTSALSILSSKGIRYSDIMLHVNELESAAREVLHNIWQDDRGIQLENMVIASVAPVDEDLTIIQQLQRSATFTDPRLAQANMIGAQMDALRNAANNSAGAITGFMGMNMAMGTMQTYCPPIQSNINPNYNNQLNNTKYNVDKSVEEMVKEEWICECGQIIPVEFGFCPKCGRPRL